MCREKWNSHINPQVKKTGWSTAEDLELFELIDQYGCRWALISRELKGIRSEHTVKNRYSSLCKNARKSYKMGDSKDLHLRILKYLKVKLDKERQNSDKLNLSGDSIDSKCSRERSREELKERLNDSLSSSEESSDQPLFTYESVRVTEEPDYLTLPTKPNISFDYLEFKKEKKTNDRDEEEEEEVTVGRDFYEL